MTSAHRPVERTQTRGRFCVLSRSWWGPYDEASFLIRHVAAAMLSAGRPADVLAPGTRSGADGAFDVRGAGAAAEGGTWPAGVDRASGALAGAPYEHVLVEGGDGEAVALAAATWPAATIVVVGREPAAGSEPVRRPPAAAATLVADLCPVDGSEVRVGVPVPVRAGVSRWLGARTGSPYVLVLGASAASADEGSSDGGPRPGAGGSDGGLPHPAAVLVRHLSGHRVVVVDGGVASSWRHRRRLRHGGGVHSRTDLQRLLAHASVTVDTAPGRLFGRECVESLRYGVPVVVPLISSTACLAGAGGGRTFGSDEELVGAVRLLLEPRARREAGDAGRAATDEWYGDPEAFVARVAAAIDQ